MDPALKKVLRDVPRVLDGIEASRREMPEGEDRDRRLAEIRRIREELARP